MATTNTTIKTETVVMTPLPGINSVPSQHDSTPSSPPGGGVHSGGERTGRNADKPK